MKENKKQNRPYDKQTSMNTKDDYNARDSHGKNDIPGINTPGIELPAFNPPVPNRAWTAMKNGVDIDALSPEEKRNLYLGRDNGIK